MIVQQQMPKATRREWMGLIAIVLPLMLLSMDLTILHLAVPTLTVDLQPSPLQLLWMVDIYGFFLAGSLITMGSLGDRIGRRRLLLIGATAFALASLLAAFSTTAGMLIAARAILGIAAATLAPSTLSLIRNMFHDPIQRTSAIAVWGTSFAAGGALGPLIGGLLLEHFWWGAVFLIPVPVMGLLLLLGPRLLPEFRNPASGRLDLISAALSLAAVLAMIYGFKLIAQEGIGTMPPLWIAAGLVLGLVFIRRQKHLAHPLIDLQLFNIPVFSVTVVTLTLNAFSMFASSFFNAQYYQLVSGLSPLQAGLWTLAPAVTIIVASMLSPVLVRRAPRGNVMIGCLLLCALGFGIQALVGQGGFPVLIIGSMIVGMGAGPVGTLSSDTIVSSAPPERVGAAAALPSTCAEFGGALGIAILGSVATFVYRLTMANATLPANVKTAPATLGDAVAVSHHLSAAAGAGLLSTARNAFSHAFVTVSVINALLMAFSAGLMAVVVSRKKNS